MGEGAAPDYELVMAAEEQIYFISDELMAGNLAADGKAAAPPKPMPLSASESDVSLSLNLSLAKRTSLIVSVPTAPPDANLGILVVLGVI